MAFADKSNRITIVLNDERCLHARSVWAKCSLCIDSCPGGAISRSKKQRTPNFDPVRCVQCGQCLSACPLGVFEASDFTERRLLDRIDAAGTVVIRCFLPYGELEGLSAECKTYQLGACIAALSPGALFELALGRPCILSTERCSSCPIMKKAEPTMRANITGAFRMLHGIGKSGNLQESGALFLPQLKMDYASATAEMRHEMLKSGIRSLFAGRYGSKKMDNVIPLRQQSKHVPAWRKRLKDVWMKNAYASSGACSFEWPELVVNVDKCVACGICMQMCPTGTIVHSFDGECFAYSFVPGTCANCGLCIKVCPRSALSRGYRSFDSPFEEQTCYKGVARKCAQCGRPSFRAHEGALCAHCEHESKRVPMVQMIRARLGVKSPGDLERESCAVHSGTQFDSDGNDNGK